MEKLTPSILSPDPIRIQDAREISNKIDRPTGWGMKLSEGGKKDSANRERIVEYFSVIYDRLRLRMSTTMVVSWEWHRASRMQTAKGANYASFPTFDVRTHTRAEEESIRALFPHALASLAKKSAFFPWPWLEFVRTRGPQPTYEYFDHWPLKSAHFFRTPTFSFFLFIPSLAVWGDFFRLPKMHFTPFGQRRSNAHKTPFISRLPLFSLGPFLLGALFLRTVSVWGMVSRLALCFQIGPL